MNKLLALAAALAAVGIGLVVGSYHAPFAIGAYIPQPAVTDEGTFTQGTTQVSPIGAMYQPNSGTTNLTAGQAGSLRVDVTRYLLTGRGMGLTTLSAWAAGTTSGTAQTVLSGNTAFNAVLVQLNQGSGISAGAITFEYSNDGTNWTAVEAYRVIDPTSSSGATISIPYTLVASTNKQFLILVNGSNSIRIKVSTTTAGGSVTPYVTPVPYDIFTAPQLVQGTVTTTGTITANQGGAPWANNITQFGGTNVSTGTGAGGTGIPRFTISNDSSLAANQSVNAAQIGGNSTAISQLNGSLAVGGGTATNTALTSTTYPLVVGGSDYGGTAKVQNWKVDSSGNGQINTNQIGGSAVSTAATGVQKVGIVGNGGATLDAAAGSAPTNALAIQGISSGVNVGVSGTVTSQFSTNNAATTPHICGTATYKHITSATDTQIIASSGSTNIYICDYEFSASAALNFYIEKSSTGTCGSPTQIGMLWTLVANQGKAAANAFYRGFNTGASQQLCVNTSAGNLDITFYTDQY